MIVLHVGLTIVHVGYSMFFSLDAAELLQILLQRALHKDRKIDDFAH